MKRYIINLVRKYLGLKKYEAFQFVGQKSDAVYYFGHDAVYKAYSYGIGYGGTIRKSNVSLNWLLDEDCKIEKVGTIDLKGFGEECF